MGHSSVPSATGVPASWQLNHKVLCVPHSTGSPVLGSTHSRLIPSWTPSEPISAVLTHRPLGTSSSLPSRTLPSALYLHRPEGPDQMPLLLRRLPASTATNHFSAASMGTAQGCTGVHCPAAAYPCSGHRSRPSRFKSLEEKAPLSLVSPFLMLARNSMTSQGGESSEG